MSFTSWMFEFLIRVKWVNHVNRVSSNIKPAKYIGMFLAVAIFIFWGASCVLASEITSQKVVDLANADRKDKGVPELVENEKLSQAAANKAEDMIINDYFSHTSPKGVTPWRWIEKENYDYNYAGENLAMDFMSAEKMNEAWLASPTHRANILNEKYKEIGVAEKEGIINGHTTTVVVQVFGSGDKNAPEKMNDEESRQKKETPNKGSHIPALPSDEEKANNITFASPLLTSPQEDEILNGEKINVFGRANPQSVVTIYDNGVAVGDAISDEKGWFRLEIKNISGGSHDLIAAAENVSAGKNETRISNKVSFAIDREKPSLSYHLYANNQKNNYLVSLSSDKKNCYFQLGEKKAVSSSSGAAIFSIKANQSSIVATVSDQAGNKSRKQIVLANYFAGGERSFFGDLALSFLPQTAYAADSGREALAANLGIAPRQLLSSR